MELFLLLAHSWKETLQVAFMPSQDIGCLVGYVNLVKYEIKSVYYIKVNMY